MWDRLYVSPHSFGRRISLAYSFYVHTGIKEAFVTDQIFKPYKVMLYHASDHEWIDCGSDGWEFDDRGDALQKRNEENQGLEGGTFEHYGVLEVNADGSFGKEIDVRFTQCLI